MIENAIFMAVDAHYGQLDKGNMPYIIHPLSVMLAMRQDGFNEEIQCAAVLHDVVEDTYVTLDRVEIEFGTRVMGYVDYMTRRDNETYKEYRIRCLSEPGSCAIKLYDSMHNLNRREGVTDKDFLEFIANRYGGTVAIIQGMLAENPHLFDHLKG